MTAPTAENLTYKSPQQNEAGQAADQDEQLYDLIRFDKARYERECSLPWIPDGRRDYGYRVNIRCPYISDLWKRWRRKYEPTEINFPASDESRLTFECDVIPHLERRFRSKAPAPYLPPSLRDKLPVELLERIYGEENVRAVRDRIQSIKK